MANRARGRLGGRTLNRAEVRDAMEDGRIHCVVGLVVQRPNESSHFELEEDDAGNPVDVLVEVDLMPRREAVTARLGALAGGPGCGVWRVPPPGTEVLVAVPRGELENAPVIVCELSSRSVPGALDQDSLVVINPGRIVVASKNSKVYLGTQDGNGTEPAVLGNSLETRLSDLESKFLAHTHPIPVQAGTINTVSGTCSIPVGATSATTSTLPHDTDNIKASGVEVK